MTKKKQYEDRRDDYLQIETDNTTFMEYASSQNQQPHQYSMNMKSPASPYLS